VSLLFCLRFVRSYADIAEKAAMRLQACLQFLYCLSYLGQYSHGLWAGRPGLNSRQRQGFSLLHSVHSGSAGPPRDDFTGHKAAGASS
jgi:hypothetical protein